MKIDHIAIAVNDVEESAKIYQQALGIDEIEFESLSEDKNDQNIEEKNININQEKPVSLKDILIDYSKYEAIRSYLQFFPIREKS